MWLASSLSECFLFCWGFLFPLLNTLGKAEHRRSELLGEIFKGKGINSCQQGCGMCLSACQLLQKWIPALRAYVWQQPESPRSLLLPSAPDGNTKAKAAGSGLSQIRSFLFVCFNKRDLTLAQETTEKRIEGGWDSCPASFHVPQEAQSTASQGLPSVPPLKEGPALKFSGDAWGKVREDLHRHNHLTFLGVSQCLMHQDRR